MPRHIAWFNEAPVEPSATGDLTSADTGVLRRCLAPAREIEKRGFGCSVFGNLRDADPAHVGKHLQKLNADIVVIGRISGPSLLKLARVAKHLGCYVVVDCGNATDMLVDFVKLAEITDQFVAGTLAVAEAIAKKSGVAATIIPDCDEAIKGVMVPDRIDAFSPSAIAKLWLDCFQKLKMKPPACANTNEPEKH